MKNFILFIVAALALGFSGYLLYRVYVKGESPDAVFQELRQKKERPDLLAEAKEANRAKNYVEASEKFQKALAAHDSDEPGAKLDEEDYKELLLMIGACYTKLWDVSGKADDALRRKAERIYERYIEEFPDREDRRRVGRAMRQLRQARPTPKVVDEAPP